MDIKPEKKYGIMTFPDMRSRDIAELADELGKLDLPYKVIVTNKDFNTLSKADIDEMISALETVRDEK
jgi:hypothetical protein